MTRVLFFTAGALLGAIAGWATVTAITNLSRHGLGEPYL